MVKVKDTADKSRAPRVGAGLFLPLMLLWLLLPAGRAAGAGDISCRAEVDRTSVQQGETITLTVRGEGDLSWSADFQLPDLPGVQAYGGGTNQSVSYVNGSTMTTVSKSFFLRVDTDKDFTIGPVIITSGDNSCSTRPIAIKVTPGQGSGASSIPPSQTGNRVAAPNRQPAVSGGEAGDDIFITLEADTEEAWLGQQIVLSFKYYRRIQPWNNPRFIPPRTEGFWREDLGQERRYRSIIDGRSYSVSEIRYAIFPQRAGELRIEPAELAFADQGLDRFFSTRRQRGPRVLRTDPVIIKVKPLPEPRPENFSGLVATDVRLAAVTDREQAPRGEPVGWTVQLVSDGFLKGFTGLELPEPADARTHDAGENFATQLENNHLISAITVEKVIVPAAEGVLEVPTVELSWFDAASGLYRLSHSPRARVLINPSDLPYLPADDSGFLRNEVARLGEDLAFIHPVPGSLATGGAGAVLSPLWWSLLLAPLILLGGWRLYLVKLSAERRDPAGRRRRRALRQARQALAAVTDTDDRGAQMAQLARALAGFTADCTNVPVAAVGPAEVQSFARDLGAVEAGNRLRQIMDLTETWRFGGLGGAGDEDGDPARLVAESSQLLGDLFARLPHVSRGPSRKAGPALGMLALLILLAPAAGRAAADPQRLMAEAAQAYTEGDLDTALLRYQETEAAGVRDAVLFFNMGNTYARQGQLGRAIACYLRAQRLDPRDRDIARNLTWVRSHIADLELGEAQLPLFIAQAVWLMRALTLGEWSVVLVVLVWALAGLLAHGWYREGFSENSRRLGLVLTGLLVVVAAVFLWRWQGEEVRRQAVVVVEEAAVHSGPDESFPVLFEVHDGLTVFLEDDQQGWGHISLGGEKLGWLPRASLLTVKPED